MLDLADNCVWFFAMKINYFLFFPPLTPIYPFPQIFDNKYVNDQIIQVRTESRITSREKVTNIRDMQGNYIWVELDFPTETPTVFEVMGTTPITDPFGRVIGYNSSMKRSENQQIGL